ncbi:MBL fold metallo-hydrolase [Nocardia iowensis]|uniref:MBL fold metallo-hydrolase n=1 Tax=Nocardia iowensis TaxID=204891 RepID=A0ABX8RKC6_NOCIO|nr:MBL fold metallo-hydrolase [Nocardia iowensis]QXN88715.1 MBL fold metallo-hydrolase [Nocardia iowensis]
MPNTPTSWHVGSLVVHRVDEVPLPPPTGSWLFPTATTALIAEQRWLHPDFADEEGALRLSSHTFAVKASGLRILVDTGIGNGKTRANPAWHNLRSDYLRRLSAVGFAPDAVDLVIMTHLHTDHVGWNTYAVDGTWMPTFPNARYLASRTEWEFWAGYDMDAPRRQMFRDSIDPIEDAGLLDLIDVPDAGTDIIPGLQLIPTPGHTPGQVAVRLDDGEAAALITGDCIHHPIQLAHPDIVSCVDIDPTQAAATRRTLLASLADTDTLLLGSHFPPPTAGRVIRVADTYRLTSTHAETQTATW